jgi:hypothetical protein
MLHVALLLAAAFAIIWAFVIFPSFRIAAGIFVALAVGAFYLNQQQSDVREQKLKAEALKKEETEKVRAAKLETRRKERWSLVSPLETQVKDITISSRNNVLNTYAVAASVRNNSKMRITAIEANIVVNDCQLLRPSNRTKQQKEVATENCEIIGQAHNVFDVSIPPGQTRGVESEITLRNLPKFQGRATYKMEVVAVKANSPNSTEMDDLLEKFDIVTDDKDDTSRK